MINAGVKLNDISCCSIPPLHIAAKTGYIELIKVLLEGGASHKLSECTNNSGKNDGKTPTQIALENKQHKVAEFITTYHHELKRKKIRHLIKLLN